jgi:PAS domain-containing protein
MDFALKPPTRHAPAERSSIDRIREDHALVLGAEVAGPLLDAIPDPLAVVTETRQFVLANRAFLEFAGASRLDDILGLRMGEVLGCPHAQEDLSGCGTHPTCKTCGAVNAVMHALGGRSAVADVELTVESQGRECSLCFVINATPLTVRGRQFVLIGISHPDAPLP